MIVRVCRGFAPILIAALVSTSPTMALAQKKTHLGGKASGLVTLFANVTVGTTTSLQEVGPDGNVVGDFVIPQGRVLVVTDLVVSVNGTPAPGVTRGGLINQSHTGVTAPYFSFDATQQGGQTIHLTSGVRWREAPEAVNAGDSSNHVFLHAHGYLVKDK
jgi:hypothetical protein